MNRTASLLTATAIMLILFVAGCGQSVVVTGQVTYEGKPVEEGSINFLPEDGQGPTCGGAINDGRYQATCPKPGRKIAQIVGIKKINFALTSEEMARAAEQAEARGDRTGIVERADVVPPNAQGNNTVVELTAGRQQLDFHLRRPQ